MTISRYEFNQAVYEFERQHGNKIDNLLKNKKILNKFLNIAEIRDYLIRDSSRVEFDTEHPNLMDTPKEANSSYKLFSKTQNNPHLATDHYELTVYRTLPNLITYRNQNINTAKFYTEGTLPDFRDNYLNLWLRREIQETQDIVIMPPQEDFYHIIDTLKAQPFLNNTSSERFILAQSSQIGIGSSHATTLLGIKDPSTHELFAVIFINSWQNKAYSNYTRAGFNALTTLGLYNQISLDKHCRNLFNVELNPDGSVVNNGTFKSSDGKSICFTDPKIDLSSPEGREAESSKNIRYIFMIDRVMNKLEVLVKGRTIPFIDASHHIQTEENDQNCTLYAYHFILAIIQLLKNPTEADRIFNLAKKLSNEMTDIESNQQLFNIFNQELKAYLPNYYDSTTQEALPIEMRNQWNLRFRWDTGSKQLQEYSQSLQTECSQNSSWSSCVIS